MANTSVIVVAGENGQGIYGYAPEHDYTFQISDVSFYEPGPTGSVAFAPAGEGFVFQAEIDFDHTLFFSDGDGAEPVRFAANGDSLDAPTDFLDFNGDAIFFDGFTSPVYISDGPDAPEVLLPSSYVPSYITLGEPLFASVGGDIIAVDSDLNTEVIFDRDNNTTGVDMGAVSFFFEFDGDLWVRAALSGGLRSDFFRYDPDSGNWTEMNVAEDTGGDDLRFNPNTVGETQFFGWINTSDAGWELHVSDGSVGGWSLVQDIRPGTYSSYVSASQSAMIGDSLVFLADDGGGDGSEVWVSDGTSAGTFNLSGTGTSVGAFSSFGTFESVGTQVFFTADGPTGFGLHVTDGTQAGTRAVLTPSSTVVDFSILGTTEDGVYFTSTDLDGSALWFSDGTVAGTVEVTNFSPEDDDFNSMLAFLNTFTLQEGNLPLNEETGTPDADSLVGIGLADDLRGNEGADTLDGGDGSDMLDGGGDDDRLFGGAGDDTIFGGAGDDFIRGDDGADTLEGGAGNDAIFAGPTDNAGDLIRGELGNDVMGGGAGDDTIFGGSGADTAYGGEGNDSISMAGTDSSSNTVWSGDADDTIEGGDGDDVLGGGRGDDVISAGPGNDTVYGGRGNGPDDLDGGSGNDLVFGGGGDDTIRGGAGQDILYNGVGNDIVEGGAGDDLLWGGPGEDVLTGAAGNDVFAFVAGNGSDTITDFEDGGDLIRIADGANDFSEVTVTESADDVEITFEDVAITLQGIAANQLAADDFLFG